MQEYEQNLENSDDRDFEPEEVYEETRMKSTLKEAYEFVTRKKFQDYHDCFPDEVKRQQLQATDYCNNKTTGIVKLLSNSVSILEVETERTITKRKYLMRADKHLYKRQANRVYNAAVSKASLSLGQEIGGKYKTTKQAIVPLIEKQLEGLLQQHRARVSSQEVDGGALSALIAGCDGGKVVAAADFPSAGDIHREAKGASAGDPAIHDDSDALAMPVPSSMKRSSPASSLCSPPAKTAKSEVGWTRAKSQDWDAASVASSVACVEDMCKKSRVQPPSYWLSVVTVDSIFEGKNMNKQIGFAHACAQRNAVTFPTEARYGETIQLDHILSTWKLLQDWLMMLIPAVSPCSLVDDVDSS